MERIIRSDTEETRRRIEYERAYRQFKRNLPEPHVIDVVFEVSIEPEILVDVETTETIEFNSVFDEKFIYGIPTVKHPLSTAKPKMSDELLADYNGLIRDICSSIRGVYSRRGLEYVGYRLEKNSYSCYIQFLSHIMNQFNERQFDNWMFRFRISDHYGKDLYSKSDQITSRSEKDDGVILLENIVIGNEGNYTNTFHAFLGITRILSAIVAGDYTI